MTREALLAADLTRSLPDVDSRRLAEAVEAGPAAVLALRGGGGSPQVRWACDRALALGPSPLLAGALRGAAAVRAEPAPTVDVVWGGPDSSSAGGRLTSAVITECLDGATSEVLIVGYAVHDEPSVIEALERAVIRSVRVTLLCERRTDNPRFQGSDRPFPQLIARRLAWVADVRPTGASLHAKVLVVDRRAALIGSANLTGAALGRNLECGVLVTGGPLPASVCDHIDGLVRDGRLRTV